MMISLHHGCPHSGEIHFGCDAIFSTEAQPESIHVSCPCSILHRRLLIAKVSIIIYSGFIHLWVTACLAIMIMSAPLAQFVTS